MVSMDTAMEKQPKKRIAFYIDRKTDAVLKEEMAEACETNVSAMLCKIIRSYAVRTEEDQRNSLEERVMFLESMCRKLMEKD